MCKLSPANQRIVCLCHHPHSTALTSSNRCHYPILTEIAASNITRIIHEFESHKSILDYLYPGWNSTLECMTGISVTGYLEIPLCRLVLPIENCVPKHNDGDLVNEILDLHTYKDLHVIKQLSMVVLPSMCFFAKDSVLLQKEPSPTNLSSCGISAVTINL